MSITQSELEIKEAEEMGISLATKNKVQEVQFPYAQMSFSRTGR